jgi:L,D-transpeptidase catalytic domain
MSSKLPPLESDCQIASPRLWLPIQFFITVSCLGIPFTEDVLWISVKSQLLMHFVPLRFKNVAHLTRRYPDFVPLENRYRISTSRFGISQVAGSNGTPLGLHRIAEKIGGGWPVGTVFKSRKPIGCTWRGMPDAKITTRILWLEGLEPGFNRGGNVDSHARYIYIHGTGDETTIGRPASCGCIHLAARDLVPLSDKLPAGTLVWISEK